MNKLEKATIDLFPVFPESKSEIEEIFDVELKYVKDSDGVSIRLDSGRAGHYLPKEIFENRPKGTPVLKSSFSIDTQEADMVLDQKRKELGADAVVNVTYAGPYCRNVSDNTILARGYPVKIVEKSSK